jgi:uncharacterized membrane protein
MAALGITLIALGAVLRYAVTAEASGIDLDMVGVIMMATGAIGLVFGIFEGRMRSTRTETHVSDDGDHVVEKRKTTQL